MVARVTEAEVIEIKADAVAPLAAFIAASTLIVDAIALDCASGKTAAELKEIERWLAAHFVTIGQTNVGSGGLASERFESGSKSWFTGSLGKGIESTFYGQTANSLANGCLGEFQKPSPGLISVGST